MAEAASNVCPICGETTVVHPDDDLGYCDSCSGDLAQAKAVGAILSGEMDHLIDFEEGAPDDGDEAADEHPLR